MPAILTPSTLTSPGNLITSIRYQIPDRTNNDDPAADGNAFTAAQLMTWINDASELIAIAAPVIKDWWGVQSITGQDIYPLPAYLTDVMKAWFDLKPLTVAAEGDDIFTTKVSGPSWWFGMHATPSENNSWHIWPSPNRTGAVTTLTASITATDTSIPITTSVGFMSFGFMTIESELIRYASLPNPTGAGNITNVLRGQGGTAAAGHNNGSTVTENNVMLQVSRLPIRIQSINNPLEIPIALWPLIELYVLSKVRESEQNHEMALQMRQDFFKLTEQLANKAQLQKPRQGLQVRILPMARQLYAGRVYIP